MAYAAYLYEHRIVHELPAVVAMNHAPVHGLTDAREQLERDFPRILEEEIPKAIWWPLLPDDEKEAYLYSKE